MLFLYVYTCTTHNESMLFQFVIAKRALQLSSFCVLPLVHAAASSREKRMASGIYWLAVILLQCRHIISIITI